jgi:hypothetical protein
MRAARWEARTKESREHQSSLGHGMIELRMDVAVRLRV